MRTALARIEGQLPVPWDIDELVQRLARLWGRLIHLVPWTFAPCDDDRKSGLWIPTATADYIFYDRDATPTRREQIIGHELGHMLLGHVPQLQDAAPELLTALAPSLSADLTRRLLTLARDGYSRADEAAAEQFGTALIRLGTTKRAPGGPDELGRLTDALQ